MISFFSFIIDVIHLFMNYIENAVLSMVDLVILIVSAVINLTAMNSYLPPFLGVFTLFVVIIGALKMFFAWGGNQ